MKVRLPSVGRTSWYARELPRAVGEIVASIAPASVAVIAAIDAHRAGDRAKLVAAIGAAVSLAFVVWNGIARLLAARQKDRDAADLSHPMHLLAPLRVLYALVAQKKRIADDDAGRLRFRVTLHSHDDAHGMHEQIVPYVGGRKLPDDAVVGRRWSTRCGIVGQVIRSRTARHVPTSEHVRDEQSYRRDLVELYGYTEDEAYKLQPMRLDVVAIPIAGLDGQIVAVLYADSSERGFLEGDIAELCVTVSVALTEHIHKTYEK